MTFVRSLFFNIVSFAWTFALLLLLTPFLLLPRALMLAAINAGSPGFSHSSGQFCVSILSSAAWTICRKAHASLLRPINPLGTRWHSMLWSTILHSY